MSGMDWAMAGAARGAAASPAAAEAIKSRRFMRVLLQAWQLKLLLAEIR
jgi:hypothetical protein